MRTFLSIGAVFVTAAILSMGVANADYIQGFEGSGYNFYADPGSSAGVSTTVSYGGSQSAQFTLDDTHFAYTRWRSEDISALGLTVGDVTASDWVMRTLGRSDLAPYFLFTVASPNTSYGETMVIQFAMPTIADKTWTQNIVGRNTTTFHVVGDRTGLTPGTFSAGGTQGTLDALAATTYSGSTKWGDLAISYVRIGVGNWDASQTWDGYADALTVSGGAVPEPSALLLFGTVLCGLAGALWRRR